MQRWKDNWNAISPIFKFSAAIRKVIYPTNAIESLNSANVNHFFTLLGKMFFTPYGKEFFTSLSKQIFTS